MTNNPKITVNNLLKGLIGSGIIITDWNKLNKRMDVLFGCNTNIEITINRKKEQVLIDVKGGVVQNILTTCENTDFTVIDWDNIECGQGENDLYEMGDYEVEIKTEGDILNAINKANQEILDNNKFYNEEN
jgi:hypothetical protein